MSEIIPFDFDEQAVRVLMRDGAPWFVAADVCRVLEIGNSRDAVSRLDDDEKGVATTDTLGGAQKMTIISESGLYALIVTSRKAEARRFRKWVTGEVLPSIRRNGRYVLPISDEPLIPSVPGGGTLREVEMWLSLVREARLLAGTRAGLSMWARSPLPPLSERQAAQVDPQDARACLAHLVDVAVPLAGDDAALARLGLRDLGHGLFVMNGNCPAFDGTKWAGGLHRNLLLTLPGAELEGPRTLAGVVARGVVVPAALLPHEASDVASFSRHEGGMT